MIIECTLIRGGDRKVAAFPQSMPFRVRLQLVGLLPTDTWRKKLINRLLLRLPLFLLPPPFRQRTSAVNLFEVWHELNSLDQQMETSLIASSTWLMQWPSLEYRKRIYLYSYDENKRSSLFAKFTFGSPDNERLRNERKALEFLSMQPPAAFSLPSVMSATGNDTSELLVFKAFEPGSKPNRSARPDLPDSWIDSYRGAAKAATVRDIQQLDWWLEFSHAPGSLAELRRFIECCREQSARLGTIHGDLGSGNIRELRDGSLCIFDWENFTDNGPFETDRLHYWIARHHRHCLRNPEEALSELTEFTSQQGINELDLALSLAFLISKDSLAALRLGECWGQSDAGFPGPSSQINP